MKRIIIIVFVLGTLVWTGCQQPEVMVPDQPLEKVDSVWTLTVKAVINDVVETKGLSIGEGDTEATTTELQSIWKEGELVYVYQGGTRIGLLSVVPNGTDAHYATLSGEVVTTDITAGSTRLTLFGPRSMEEWSYTGQVGILLAQVNEEGKSIESLYHLVQAQDVLVTEVSGNNITTEPATFENQQSIYRLSFRFQKSGTDSKTPITTQQITLAAAGGGLWRNQDEDNGPITVVLDEATAEPFFVALRFEDQKNEEALHFQVVGSDGVTYLGSKTIPAAYKPNGTFVSIKNTTLPERMHLETKEGNDDKVSVAL